MANSARALVQTVREMLAKGAFGADGDAGPDSEDPWSDEGQAALASELFESAAEAPTPPGFEDALLLPDEVRLQWRDGDVAGELAIANPHLALMHSLDESLGTTEIDGTTLGTLRIIDRVVDTAGPYYVCWRPDDPKPGQLYLFDLRDLDLLDCRLDAYLAAAAASRGVTFWQRLFTKGKLTPDAATALKSALKWLEKNAPDAGLADLRSRLEKRT